MEGHLEHDAGLGGMRRFGVRCGVWGYDGVLECDAVFWSATRHAASLQRPWGLS